MCYPFSSSLCPPDVPPPTDALPSPAGLSHLESNAHYAIVAIQPGHESMIPSASDGSSLACGLPQRAEATRCGSIASADHSHVPAVTTEHPDALAAKVAAYEDEMVRLRAEMADAVEERDAIAMELERVLTLNTQMEEEASQKFGMVEEAVSEMSHLKEDVERMAEAAESAMSDLSREIAVYRITERNLRNENATLKRLLEVAPPPFSSSDTKEDLLIEEHSQLQHNIAKIRERAMSQALDQLASSPLPPSSIDNDVRNIGAITNVTAEEEDRRNGHSIV